MIEPKHFVVIKLDDEQFNIPLGENIVSKLKDAEHIGFDIIKESIERHSLLGHDA